MRVRASELEQTVYIRKPLKKDFDRTIFDDALRY
jgi:hypothetical protein